MTAPPDLSPCKSEVTEFTHPTRSNAGEPQVAQCPFSRRARQAACGVSRLRPCACPREFSRRRDERPRVPLFQLRPEPLAVLSPSRRKLKPCVGYAPLNRRRFACLQMFDRYAQLASDLSQRFHRRRSRATLDPRDVRIADAWRGKVALRQAPLKAESLQSCADVLSLRHAAIFPRALVSNGQRRRSSLNASRIAKAQPAFWSGRSSEWSAMWRNAL